MTKALLVFAQYTLQKFDIHFVLHSRFLPENVETLQICKAVPNHLTYCGMHSFWIIRLLQKNQTVTITKNLRRKLLKILFLVSQHGSVLIW